MTEPALSVQLYTLRDALAADREETFAHLARLGVRRVEAYDIVAGGTSLAESLARHGLTSPSVHAPLVIAGENDAATLDEVFDAAERLGAHTVFEPMVWAEHWLDEDAVRRTAERLNHAAALAASRGLRVGYHNHSQEFHHEIDGRSAYEFFVSLLRDDVVLELDAYWAAVGRQDVPALVGRLGRRLRALHVKDGSTAFDPFLPDASPGALDQVPAGQGEVPLAAALAAAGSLELAVLEFDEYDGDLFDALAAGVAFLAEAGIR